MIIKNRIIELSEMDLCQVNGGESTTELDNNNNNNDWNGRDFLIDAVIHWDEYEY